MDTSSNVYLILYILNWKLRFQQYNICICIYALLWTNLCSETAVSDKQVFWTPGKYPGCKFFIKYVTPGKFNQAVFKEYNSYFLIILSYLGQKFKKKPFSGSDNQGLGRIIGERHYSTMLNIIVFCLEHQCCIKHYSAHLFSHYLKHIKRNIQDNFRNWSSVQ